MENDVVLSDEMDKFHIVAAFPPFFPLVFVETSLCEEFFRESDVSDRRVKPDVENLSFSSFDRNGNAPRNIAGDASRFKTSFKPLFAESLDVAFPVFFSFKPRIEPFFEFVEVKEPVF